MDKVVELRKLKESDDFKEIQKKYKNIANQIETDIVVLYSDNKVSREQVYSKKDRLWEAKNIIEKLAEDVNALDTTWANIFCEFLYNRAMQIENVVIRNLVDEIWVPYSTPMFTETDMLTIRLSEMVHNSQEALDNLIASLEKEEEKEEEEIYE